MIVLYVMNLQYYVRAMHGLLVDRLAPDRVEHRNVISQDLRFTPETPRLKIMKY